MRHARTCTLLALLLATSASAFTSLAWSQGTAPSPAAPVQAATQSGTAAQNPGASTPPGTVGQDERTAQSLSIKGELLKVMGQYPPSVGHVLALDPTLLTNVEFLEAYPALTVFLDAHPEVRRNPAFYFQAPRRKGEDDDVALAGITAGVIVPLGFLAFLGGAFYLAHRYKTAALKARQETQTRVLDQLLAREDLSGYLTTPAGRRLLESVMEPGEARKSTAANRIIGAVGAGAVLLTIGLGVLILSPIVGLGGEELWFFKVVPTILGAGFVVSAGATYLLSKRFGLIQTPDTRD